MTDLFIPNRKVSFLFLIRTWSSSRISPGTFNFYIIHKLSTFNIVAENYIIFVDDTSFAVKAGSMSKLDFMKDSS